jgi:hypothetical protein
MGWSSGSRLFSEIIEVIQEHVESDVLRTEIYKGLITAFETADCDTLDECIGEDESFDNAWEELNPTSDDESWEDDDTDRGF